MSNPYFRFKQFTIFHDRCAMKVGTDGVLLGAWADITDARQILDIGTGTGLIALMLAQRTQAQAHIDAVEIDLDAYIQAKENVKRSPWSERIQVYHNAIQDYVTTCPKQYDLIISNPPFFENAYKAPNQARTLARHSDTLMQFDLLQTASTLLHDSGRLVVIYPPEQAKIFQDKATAFNFYCNKKLNIKPTNLTQIKRTLLELSQTNSPYQENTIALSTTHNHYTPEFITLIKNFYLKY